MSTRCQVILRDKFDEKMWFYRHSDGYPKGTFPSLLKFVRWIEKGLIRTNILQAGGWLIMLGAEEYGVFHKHTKKGYTWRKKTYKERFAPTGGGYGWKVGAYEPDVPGLHCDTAFVYTIDMENVTITKQEVVGYDKKKDEPILGPGKVMYRCKDMAKVLQY